MPWEALESALSGSIQGIVVWQYAVDSWRCGSRSKCPGWTSAWVSAGGSKCTISGSAKKAVNPSSRILIAGHAGMVGSAIVRELIKNSYNNLLMPTRSELDLREQLSVNAYFEDNKPDVVFLCAARVGGIQANINNPADYIVENLQIQTNVITSAYMHGVKKLIFMASSCIYPRECPQPMKEEYLLTGKLEPTNEYYAISKIAGIKMIEAMVKQYGFNGISIIPCNLYGPNDSFDLSKSHVLSALVKRFVDAKNENLAFVNLWGSGNARREFLYVEDMARAAVHLANSYEGPEPINIGSGSDISIRELAYKVAAAAGYQGRIEWDLSMPDGMPRKCMDVHKQIALGILPEITLDEGINRMIMAYSEYSIG